MKTVLSAQQTAHFTKNGSIEFEIDTAKLFPSIHRASSITRDLWRKEPDLQKFIIRKLGPIAIALTGKKQLRLGCDQWFSKEELPKKAFPIKELIAIQGLALGACFAEDPQAPARKSALGILPQPSAAGRILFFKPDLILDWPHVSSDLYFVLFTWPDAVYIHNPKDPFTNVLKSSGYNFGDVLKNEFHPLFS